MCIYVARLVVMLVYNCTYMQRKVYTTTYTIYSVPGLGFAGSTSSMKRYPVSGFKSLG